MKKNIFLWIILIILLIMIGCLILLKNQTKPTTPKIQDESRTHFISYKLENYSSDKKLEGTGENKNFSLDFDEEKSEIKICILNYKECSNFKYEKEDEKYIITSENKQFMNGELTIEEDSDEEFGEIIKAIITYTEHDNTSNIIYFEEKINN